MAALFDKKYVFFGGKGGTGKTTCAAAFSLKASEMKKKVLLVSTDPAHSLSDIYDTSIGPKGAQLSDNLFAIEIDPEVEAKKYIEGIKRQLSGVVSNVVIEALQKQIDAAYMSPGSEEAAIFDKFIEIMESSEKKFDLVVFDTAPTGHTLRLLSLPKLLGLWINSLIEKRKNAVKLLEKASGVKNDDPVLRILQNRKNMFEKAWNILSDFRQTAFVFVLTPERLPIFETERAMQYLEHSGIKVAGVVVNGVIPQAAEGAFMNKRREVQNRYIREIHGKFKEKVLAEIDLLDEDIWGIDNLRRIAEML
ncbi:ArsA family ATPase [Acetomicrobium hydrogeniformans]|uniref:Arsenite-activated ATPase n=1 Tax=Acetomicrobium hydrogeniformans ATCC BAA-1850 TaxID=592015 RepID=A0A0T5XBD8_9BACT|nr:ArsA family ATPase [Acetomicrobium hydrogeniformans]KRT35672.1 arsenite-activated ATPase [Acetomicrobium hydrogeniformans ATCC BAA-1850]